jgi:acid phosphatase type 7
MVAAGRMILWSVKPRASVLPPRTSAFFLIRASALACSFLICAPLRAATPPVPNPTLVFKQFLPGQTIHMVAYGDMRFTDPSVTSGTNPRVRRWLAGRIAEVSPQVLLLTGDMPFTGAKTADWDEFQSETKGWRDRKILELPATGNHEIKGGAEQGIANYLNNFPGIEGHRYYSALLGSVEVISLDMTAGGAVNDPQARWFAAQLDHLPREVDYLLILYHIPWMADTQSRLLARTPSPAALVLRGILEARLNRLRAKVVVFNGHLHNYERFERKGVTYVVTGGGGAEPYPILLRGAADLYRDTGFPVYHYLTVDVDAKQLHAVMWKVKDPDATTLDVEEKDEFTIPAPPKPAAKPAPKARR